MTQPHEHAATAIITIATNFGVATVTVLAWVFDKLPSIAAAVSLGFVIWQWRRMVKKDRLDLIAKEAKHEPQEDAAG